MKINISAGVRGALGAGNADLLESGRAGVQEVQCSGCGGAAQPATVTLNLSVVLMADHVITVWFHQACGPSRVLTHEEFQAIGAPPVCGSLDPTGTGAYIGGARVAGVQEYIDRLGRGQ